ncbi:MAG: hypothetical protein HQL14_06875 [Candidatus Omnitrophica bacterium]|nr:hypothetical protein [Candidatus Omnitrophota bacterium]
MNILGLNSNNENSSAALIKDGRFCGFIQEERFSRIKYDNNFPRKSIQYLLEKNRLKEAQLDFCISSFEARNNKTQYCILSRRGQREVVPGDGFHHQAHAASAYRFSSFKKANILVIDACGDNRDSITFFVGDGDRMHKIWDVKFDQISLGMIYRDATIKAGFSRNHEGKFMGLSSYGKASCDYKDIFYMESHQTIHNAYAKKARLKPVKNDPYKMPAREVIDFSATIQKCLERSVINLIKEIYRSTKISDFCFAGGIFLNSKLLGEIVRLHFINDVFVQPNAGDAGLAIGYAMEMAARCGDTKRFNFDVYSGPSFSDTAIRLAAGPFPVAIKRLSDPAQTAADLLERNCFIGWFQGGMEWGPRALGNRSILANPSIKGNNIRLNHVKGREFWRPFAPSILEEHVSRWVNLRRVSPYMTTCFPALANMKKAGCAVVHVDGTTRVQTVSFSQNPLYHGLINHFYKKTGTPFVLNTSFNYQGEPIVCSPREAVMDLMRMDLDALIAGNYLITKK